MKRKFVQTFTDLTGRQRFYFRRRGFQRVALPPPDTPEFEPLYARLCAEAEAASEHAPRVYFVKSGEFIKIGTTTHLRRRMEQLRTHSPYPIILLGWMFGDRVVEKKIQAKFAYARVRREWFEPTTELLLFIRTRNKKRSGSSNANNDLSKA